MPFGGSPISCPGPLQPTPEPPQDPDPQDEGAVTEDKS